MGRPHDLTRPREKTFQAFWMALLLAAAVFAPFILYGKGLFIYYGDFNVQQIPFYQMAHDAVRAGEFGWSWTTDLGANFIGSYSFYLLGSPFFWLTLPFPSAAVPYLMGPLLILKFACASTAAYLWLRRFVRPAYALLGGLLYAFSGFSLYNVFFNHFHEAIILFPLLLWGMERCVNDNRRGVFLVAVFFSALSNYYFFIGQAIFAVLYFLMRLGAPDFHCDVKKFLCLAAEAVLGTAAAAGILLPSYLAVIQNRRTESFLGAWDMLIYDRPQRFWDIIHSFFFPQDIPARPNFFPDSDNKWASMSAWLPLFGCTGVIAYFQSRRHTDWLRRLLLICLLCALIPVCNAMFQLFNAVYYARWYYMMVLMMVLATVRCLEEGDYIPVQWRRAFGWSAGVTGAFTLFIGFTATKNEQGETVYGLMKDPPRFWVYVALTVLCLALAALLMYLYRRRRDLFFRLTLACLCGVALLFGWLHIGLGKGNTNYSDAYVSRRAVNAADEIALPDGDVFCRIDFDDEMDNLGMFWQRPTIQAFHSIVPGSVMEFYQSIGVTRSVASRPGTAHYALRGLTSVRWLFEYADEDDLLLNKKKDEDRFYNTETGRCAISGFVPYGQQNGFYVYKNEYFVPMGFTYDHLLSRSAYNELAQFRREQVLLKALVLEDGDAERYAGVLPALDTAAVSYYQTAYLTDCTARAATAAASFVTDREGFTAVIDLPADNFVFFSVPYEAGWSATVNGQPAELVKAGVGFMAVLCPAGEGVTIRCTYRTPGLTQGLLISAAALLLAGAWCAGALWLRRRARRKTAAEAAEAE
ncbi:MAG: YfhO family protein [Clostridia bacterium]|nr:YfhO family protein [Clostridia bacterium]